MTNGLLCIGDNVVDLYCDEGVYYPGGNALNVAVMARRAGLEGAAYMGILGNDAPGRHVEAAMRAEGRGGGLRGGTGAARRRGQGPAGAIPAVARRRLTEVQDLPQGDKGLQIPQLHHDSFIPDWNIEWQKLSLDGILELFDADANSF